MDEIEAKYRLADADALAQMRARLRALGAQHRGSVREENVLFDRADGSLRAADVVLRLRVLDGGHAARLTYKGPAHRDGAVKRRAELEVAVGDAATTRAILEALGYLPRISYAKERETWRLAGAEVALDTLEFGRFCEIEGPPETIARLADALGLAPEAAEPAGYPALMARHLAR